MSTHDWRRKSLAFAAAVLTCRALGTVASGAPAPTACDSLKASQLRNTTITAADVVAPGAFTDQGAENDLQNTAGVLPRSGRDRAVA